MIHFKRASLTAIETLKVLCDFNTLPFRRRNNAVIYSDGSFGSLLVVRSPELVRIFLYPLSVVSLIMFWIGRSKSRHVRSNAP